MDVMAQMFLLASSVCVSVALGRLAMENVFRMMVKARITQHDR
jgi:hypothetical protein